MSVKSDADGSDFAQGLGILLLAQVMSAYMGAYVEDTYQQYGPDWMGNLFYSHFLSLPLFTPLLPTLKEQFAKLEATPYPDGLCQRLVITKDELKMVKRFPEWIPMGTCQFFEGKPEGVLYLAANSVMQLLCISGVNLLGAKSSAVTVTIVLNIRKLVSFILSTILFGHELSPKMIAGSALVFGAGALYGYESSYRLPQKKRLAAKKAAPGTKVADGAAPQSNGSVEKGKKKKKYK